MAGILGSLEKSRQVLARPVNRATFLQCLYQPINILLPFIVFHAEIRAAKEREVKREPFKIDDCFAEEKKRSAHILIKETLNRC